MTTGDDSDAEPGVRVESLLGEGALRLELLDGREGLSRRVAVTEVQKPGLALAGHLESLHPERVQVMGFSEVSYLEGLPDAVLRERADELARAAPPALVITRALDEPRLLAETCAAHALPLLRTSLSSAEFIRRLNVLLDARLNPTTSTHGVLVDVYGVGVLILGKSGIGKSEVSLELVLRGHRLVADDIVELQRTRVGNLIGSGPDIIKHHMEIRGLGILNIKDLFGIAAVRDTKRVDLVVELRDWDEAHEYDRLGIDEQSHTILEVEIPRIELPVRPGRNMTAIIEVAARNQLLKVRGHHSAKEFQNRLVRAIAEGRAALAAGSDEE